MNFDVGSVSCDSRTKLVRRVRYPISFVFWLRFNATPNGVCVVLCVRSFAFNSTSFRAANNLFVVCAHDLRFCLFGVIYMYIFLLFCFRSVTRIRLILFVLARFFTHVNKRFVRLGPGCFVFRVWVSLFRPPFCSIFGFSKTKVKCFFFW